MHDLYLTISFSDREFLCRPQREKAEENPSSGKLCFTGASQFGDEEIWEDDRVRARAAWPFVVLVGAAALFFREALFTGQTFYFRDITSFIYPTRRLIGDLIREGYLPLWNPYLMSGVPLVANVEYNLLYPLSVIYYLLPFDRAFTWFVVVHYPIAGVSWYLLGREWGLPRAAALFGGVAFMLSGPLISLTNVVNFLPGIAWLPLGLLGFHRAIAKESWRAGVGTSLVLALQALSDPEMVYFTLIAMGLYGLMMLRPPWAKSALTTFGALGGIGVLAGLLSAVQLIPLAELYRESVRAAGVSYKDATIWTLWLHRLAELLFPRLFGDPAGWTYWIGLPLGEFTPWLLSPYLGIPTMVMAVFGAMVLWRERLVWFLVVVVAISGTLALGDATPVHQLAFDFLPVYKAFRIPEKWWMLATFAVAGLAGIGFGTLFGPNDARRRRLSLAGVCMALAGGVLLSLLLISKSPYLFERFLAPVFRGDDLAVMTAFVTHRAINQGTLTAALLLASALCLGVVRQPRIPRRGIEACLILLLMVDLMLNNLRLAPVAAPSLHRSPSGVAQFLLQDHTPFRLFTATTDWAQPSRVWVKQRPYGYHQWLVESLYPNTGLRYRLYEHGGISSARLKDYQLLTERFAEAGRSNDNLALWNVKYVLSLREFNSPSLEPLPVPNVDPPLRVYRLRDPLPRAWVVPKARHLQDREKMLSDITEGRFNPREEVLLEGERERGGATQAGPWRAEIIGYSPNEVLLDVSTDGGGYLVLAETFYPGWRVTVDGGSRQTLRANYAMRAVRLEPGTHRVRFVYRPLSVWLGAAISLGTLLGLFALLILRRSDTFWQSR